MMEGCLIKEVWHRRKEVLAAEEKEIRKKKMTERSKEWS